MPTTAGGTGAIDSDRIGNHFAMVGECIESLGIDTPDAVVSGMKVAGGSPTADNDISVSPDVLQTAVSVTTVVSEKWMERFVINLDVLCSDGSASGDDPAGGSSDVGSDVCVVPDPLLTAVSVRTVVAEKWMDRFVLDLVECPSVSRTSAVARTFGQAVSEEYSPVVFSGGGGRLPMHTPPPPPEKHSRCNGTLRPSAAVVKVVESDTARVSDLQLDESDTVRVSVLPIAGCKFPVVFLGKVALDVVGLGVGPPCLRVDSEETLLTLIDERAQLAHAAPGVTPVDSSEEGAPVRELIRPSVLGEPLVDSPQEPMPVEKRLEYAIQATASVWEPLDQVHYVVSGYANFDSFGMAPWDAGGTHGDGCRLCGTFWKMMLQWLNWLSCRPAIVNGLDRIMIVNTENGLDRIMMTNTESPRLAVTPGEWYANDMLATMSTDLSQMNGIPEVIGAHRLQNSVGFSPDRFCRG